MLGRQVLLTRTFVLLAVHIGCFVGCSEKGPERASVKGTVTLDGQPLDNGYINFIPQGKGGGPNSGAEIRKDGTFSVSGEKGVIVGRNRVEIHATKKTGNKIPGVPPAVPEGTLIDEVAEAIPEKYNTKSTLTEMIGSEENSIDFKLKSD